MFLADSGLRWGEAMTLDVYADLFEKDLQAVAVSLEAARTEHFLTTSRGETG